MVVEQVPSIALRILDSEFRDDFEIVKEAVEGDGTALRDASSRLQDCEEIVDIAISHRPSYLFFASSRIRTSKS